MHSRLHRSAFFLDCSFGATTAVRTVNQRRYLGQALQRRNHHGLWNVKDIHGLLETWRLVYDGIFRPGISCWVSQGPR